MEGLGVENSRRERLGVVDIIIVIGVRRRARERRG